MKVIQKITTILQSGHTFNFGYDSSITKVKNNTYLIVSGYFLDGQAIVDLIGLREFINDNLSEFSDCFDNTGYKSRNYKLKESSLPDTEHKVYKAMENYYTPDEINQAEIIPAIILENDFNLREALLDLLALAESRKPVKADKNKIGILLAWKRDIEKQLLVENIFILPIIPLMILAGKHSGQLLNYFIHQEFIPGINTKRHIFKFLLTRLINA